MKKTKICFVMCDWLPMPPVLGGAIEELVQMLIDSNEISQTYKFSIICISNKEAEQLQNYQYTEFYSIRRGITYRIQYYLYRGMQKYMHVSLPMLHPYNRLIKKKLKNNQFDYVIFEGNGIRWDGFSDLLNQYQRKQFIYHIHCDLNLKGNEKTICGRAITVSEFVKKSVLRYSIIKSQNVKVLRNCIDRDKFDRNVSYDEKKELKKELGIEKEDFVIFFSGRMIPEKGIEELIDAVVGMDRPDIKLIIAGSPLYGRKKNTIFMKRILNKINSKEYIKYIGYIKNSELYKYYSIADIAVVPSICNEAACLVVLEALTAGTPVLATNKGGIAEYLPAYAGRIVEVDNNFVEHLQNQILFWKDHPAILSEYTRRARAAGMDTGKKSYFNTFDTIIKQYILEDENDGKKNNTYTG